MKSKFHGTDLQQKSYSPKREKLNSSICWAFVKLSKSCQSVTRATEKREFDNKMLFLGFIIAVHGLAVDQSQANSYKLEIAQKISFLKSKLDQSQAKENQDYWPRFAIPPS